jgi:hypothetical protein
VPLFTTVHLLFFVYVFWVASLRGVMKLKRFVFKITGPPLLVISAGIGRLF